MALAGGRLPGDVVSVWSKRRYEMIIPCFRVEWRHGAAMPRSAVGGAVKDAPPQSKNVAMPHSVGILTSYTACTERLSQWQWKVTDMDWPAVIVSVASYLVLDRILSRPGNADDARLARLEKRISGIEAHLGIERDAGREEVVTLILEGKMINAIKLYREQTGIGLREAKEAVEQMERDLKQPV
jgi:hypothetical protein